MAEGPVTIGDEVKIKGGCPHAWVVYAIWSPTAVHIQRWNEMSEGFIRQTFIDPAILVKV